MNTKRFSVVVYVTILTLTLNTVAQTQPSDMRKVLEPGYVLGLPLTEFASQSLEPTCRLLRNDQYDAAIKPLREYVAKNGNDLIAFVCLAQVDAAFRQSEARRLEQKKGAIQRDDSPEHNFKLGVVDFYNAKYIYFTRNNLEAASGLARSKQLLASAWQKNKSPVVGLVYVDAHQLPSPDLSLESKVLEQLIKELAGEQAFSTYQIVKQNNWNGQPPTLSQVSTKDLKPLRGVVALLQSLSSARFGRGVKHGNQYEFVYEPVSPDRQRMAQYLTKWRVIIDQALAQHQT